MDFPPDRHLLDEFRLRYPRLEQSVYQTIPTSYGDSIVLQRLGDDLDEFRRKVDEHLHIFPPEEASTLQTNLQVLLSDVAQAYHAALDASHFGKPTLIQRVRTGRRGQPKVVIEPGWLRWAYLHRGKSKLAKYLGCSRTVVSRLLDNYGIAPRVASHIAGDPHIASPVSDHANLGAEGPLEPHAPPAAPAHDAAGVVQQPPVDPATDYIHLQSSTRPMADLSDHQLDQALVHLRTRFPAQGVKMLQGTLQRLYGHVPQRRIRDALLRIDPVRRVFQRAALRRRRYKVPGPGSLAHHDGLHGLIRWAVVIHAFIDGFSRVITAICAHNNNCAATVLALFLEGCQRYGVPQRVRGDHGVENVLVAEWMERTKGEGRGSYIWGRSMHNIRIERLWVNVTVQFGQKWANFFTVLEAHHALDVNNTAHIWLLHMLFQDDINADATLFAEGWNRHKMSFKGEASQSPAELWGFGIPRVGLRGEELVPEDIESYGIDWEALHDDRVMESFRVNNLGGDEGVLWHARVGPPPDLNEVNVEPPSCPIASAAEFVSALNATLTPFVGAVHPVPLGQRWITGLGFCRVHHPHIF